MRAEADERKGPRPTKVKVVYFCQVDGCKAKLSNCKPYSQRYRVCPAHLGAACVELHGFSSRFCQQCGKFHPLDEFDGTKRSCRARLQHHNNSRQQRRKEAALQQSIKTAVLLQQHGTRQAVKQHKTIPCPSTVSDSPAAGTSSSSGKQSGSSNSICTSTTTTLEPQGSLTPEYASSPATGDDQQQDQQQQEEEEEDSADEDDADMDSQEECDADVDPDGPPPAASIAAAELGGDVADTIERSGSGVSYRQHQQEEEEAEKVVNTVTSSMFQLPRSPGADPYTATAEATSTDALPNPSEPAAAAARHQAATDPAESHPTNWLQGHPALGSSYSMSPSDGAAGAAAKPSPAAAALPECQAEAFGFGSRYYARCTVPGCVDCARGVTTVRYCNVPGCTDCPPPPPHIRAAILQQQQQQQQGWTSTNASCMTPTTGAVGEAPLSVPETLLPEQQQQCSSLYGRYRSLTLPDLAQGSPGSTVDHPRQYNQLQSQHSTDLAQIGSYCSPYAAAAAAPLAPPPAAAGGQGSMHRTYSDHLNTRKMSPSMSSSNSRFGSLIRSCSFTPTSGSCSPAAAARLPAPATALGGSACFAITAGPTAAAATAATLGRGLADTYMAQGIRPVTQQQQLKHPRQDDEGNLYSRSLDSYAWPTAAFPGSAAADPQQQYGSISSTRFAAMTLPRQLSLPARPGEIASRGEFPAGHYVSSDVGDLAPDHIGSDLTHNCTNGVWCDPRSDPNGSNSSLGMQQQAKLSSLGTRTYPPQFQLSQAVTMPSVAAPAVAAPAVAAAGDLATMHSEDYSSFQMPSAVGRAILYGMPEKAIFTAPGSAVSGEATAAYSSSMYSQPPPPSAVAAAAGEVSASRAVQMQNWYDASMSTEMTVAAAAAVEYEPAKYYHIEQEQDLGRPMLDRPMLDHPTKQEQQRVPLQLPRLLPRETVARSSPSRDFQGSFCDSAATAAAAPLSSIGDLAAVDNYQLGPPAPAAAATAAGRRQTAASTAAAALQQAYVSSLAATAAEIYAESESAIAAGAAAAVPVGAAVLPFSPFSAVGAVADEPSQPYLSPLAGPNPVAPGMVASNHEVPGSNPADNKDSGRILEEYFTEWLQGDDDIAMEDILDPMLSVESIVSGNVHENFDDLLMAVP